MFRKSILTFILGLLLLAFVPSVSAATSSSQSSSSQSNAYATCGNYALTINFGTPPLGTAKWAIRIDDPTNPWDGTPGNPGDTVFNNYEGTSYTRSFRGGQWYFWWIHPLSSTNQTLGTSGGYIFCKIDKTGTMRIERNGNTVTLRWYKVMGAVKYALRVNDTSNGWNETTPLPNDKIINDYSETTYTFTSPYGKHYTWWVHSIDKNGYYSDAAVSEFYF